MQSNSFNTAEELLQEISTLDVEIMHLERYLLSMYRAAFDDIVAEYNFVPANMPKIMESQDGGAASRPSLQDLMDNDQINTYINPSDTQGYLMSPDKLSEDIVRCMISIYCKLASNYSTSTPAAIPESTNNSTIIGFSSSSSSMSPSILTLSPPLGTSSTTLFSPHHRRHFNQDYSWEIEEYASSSSSSDFFQNGGAAASSLASGPCTSDTVVVSRACLELADESRIGHVVPMMKKLRSMLKYLEDIDPRKMKPEQKLTFWVNIHNALVMHDATYNVGGHFTTAYEIKSSILGCSPSSPASHITTTVTTSPTTFFTPTGGIKLKKNNNKRNSGSRHIYSLDYLEPLVYFALSSGAYSDPAVRVYTSKNIFAELNIAKQEFIRAATSINTANANTFSSLSSSSSIYNNNNYKQKHTKDGWGTSDEYNNNKVILPKVLYYFANDACLNLYGLAEMVHGCLSESQQKAMEICQQQLSINSNKRLITRMLQPDKYIQWSPYNSAFRYIIQTKQL
ncbi:uncharacterized protein LOC113299580 isoform X4 [Papaver somniferum]|uniref:uncharacterized protein LOC113299580 isoform X4 n=1 Tax=Papaver somniferum TaxID=3469 RepID=UPI000E6FD64C|nr:uncharacterized protein LOC113299580 isoform X4 [Papaver somniferum]